jgi:hypothetical protein
MGLPVIASLGLPKWRPEAAAWERLWLATPQGSYFDAPPEEFEAAYLAQLDRHGLEKVARVLHRIAVAHSADRIVLLCHEVLAIDCHRSTLAAWPMSRTGEVVPELT